MIAPELSYYPATPTDEELALLSRANRHERTQVSGDITAALGTAALAFTGGLVETPPPAIEQQDSEPTVDTIQRELGGIATSLTLSQQFTDSGYDVTVKQTYDTPISNDRKIEAAADAAYLLAIQGNSRDMTNQAIKQAAYELAA